MTDNWRDDANCLGEDPELWYRDDAQSQATAKAICQHCPVKKDCTAYAKATGQKEGMWGRVWLGPPPGGKVRRWAAANGIDLNPSGTIPNDVRAAYEAAQAAS